MTRGLAKTKDGNISQDCCPKSLVETLEGKPFNIGLSRSVPSRQWDTQRIPHFGHLFLRRSQ
jgi:hypothetical protein